MKLGFRFFILTAGLSALSAVTLASNMDMVNVSGHARARFTYTDDAGAVKHANTEAILNRVRLNIDVTPSKEVSARISPQYTGFFGDGGATNDNLTAVQNPAIQDNFSAHEAWMAYAPNDTWNVTIGRQIWSFGNELLIGADEWSREGRSFDGVHAKIKHKMGETHILYAKISSGSLLKVADRDLYGIYTILGLDQPFVKTVDLYVLWNDQRKAADRHRYAIFGTRLANQMDKIDYNLEATGEFGKSLGVDQKGVQIDATAGIKPIDLVHAAANIAYANSEYSQLYPSNHPYFGESDVISQRNNLVSYSIMTDWHWTDMLSSTVNGYYFMAPKNDTYLKSGGNVIAANQSAVGLEGDIDVMYTPVKPLTFTLGYNIFKPLTAYKNAGLTTAQNQVWLQGMLTF